MSVIDDGALTWTYQGYWLTNAGYGPAWLELVQNLNRRCDFMGVTRPTVPLMQPNPVVDPVSPVGLCSSGQTPVNARDMLSAMQTALNTLETNAAWCNSNGTDYSGFDLTVLGMTRPNLKAICEHIRQSLDEHRYANGAGGGNATGVQAYIQFHVPYDSTPEDGPFYDRSGSNSDSITYFVAADVMKKWQVRLYLAADWSEYSVGECTVTYSAHAQGNEYSGVSTIPPGTDPDTLLVDILLPFRTIGLSVDISMSGSGLASGGPNYLGQVLIAATGLYFQCMQVNA